MNRKKRKCGEEAVCGPNMFKVVSDLYKKKTMLTFLLLGVLLLTGAEVKIVLFFKLLLLLCSHFSLYTPVPRELLLGKSHILQSQQIL